MGNLDSEGPKPDCGILAKPSAPPRSAGRSALGVVVGLAGVLAVHHPMILSGFRRIQTDLGDTRLLNYFLEHGWLWRSQAPRHERFWDAPFFHPVQNVMAFSDCMISYGPLYWLFRGIGLPPDTAFGAWLVGVTVLNFGAGVLLFRRGLGFGSPAATAAAGLIAFGAPRVNLLHHPQLLPFFYLLFALHALCRIARDQDGGAGAHAGWWMMLGLAVAAQFYGGYYLGWFFVVGLAVAIVAALLLPSSRGRVVALARRDGWAAALGAVVAAVALLPFLFHYLPAAREHSRDFSNLQHHALPGAWSWWNTGEINWWWGWIDRRWPVGALYPEDLRLGLGFITTAACGLGLSLSSRRGGPLAQAAFATVIFGVAALTLPLSYVFAPAACFALACLFREPEWTGTSAAAVALTAFSLLTAPSECRLALSLTFAIMAFCLLRVWSNRARSGGWEAVGLFAALGIHALPIDLAVLLAGFFAAVGGLAAWLSPGRKMETAIGAAGLWLATAAWLTVERTPSIYYLAVLGTILGWWASRDRRWRLSPAPSLVIVVIALPVVILPFGAHSLWLAVSPFIPGSSAIRMPSRAVLVFLVPAALGLAILVERFDRGRWGLAAWCLVLICLAEQTGTTRTFDREVGRTRVARIARQVDRRAPAFYYRHQDEDDFHYHVHLDAMWAAIETSVPTVNGMSGCFPAGWSNLGEADLPGRMTFDDAMRAWYVRHGGRQGDVQIITRPVD